MSLGWGINPVMAFAPYTQSIPNLADAYILPVVITHYDIPKFNLRPTGNGQCVDFIKANGFGKYRGNAHEWAKYINTDKPNIGGVVVLDEGRYGHLALVIGIENGIQLAEQNFEGLYQVSYRTISPDYEKIVGFIRK